MKSDTEKLKTLYKKLLLSYGPQGWWPLNGFYDKKNTTKQLTKDEQFEISVGAILTQNAAWKNVEAALQNLRKENALSKEAILKMDAEKLAHLIKTSIYHNQKTKKLKLFAQFLDEKKPITRENLLNLWGIGPETADSILLYAYRQPVFVIDAYTRRICKSQKLAKEDLPYDSLQDFFMKNLPKDNKLFNEFHALIVAHAKQMKKETNVHEAIHQSATR